MLLKVGRVKTKQNDITNWYNETEKNVTNKEKIELICLLCGKKHYVVFSNIFYGLSINCRTCRYPKNHNKYEKLQLNKYVKVKTTYNKKFNAVGKIVEIIKYKHLLIFNVRFTVNVKQLYFGFELERVSKPKEMVKKKVKDVDSHAFGRCPKCDTHNLSIYINLTNCFKLVCLKHDCDYITELSDKRLDTKIVNHLIELVKEFQLNQKYRKSGLAKLTYEERKALNLS